MSTCFAGEADVWYETDPDWMEDEGRTWDEFVDRFVTRFRPSNYEQQLLEQLMRPKQSDNEGVQKYADRCRGRI